MKQLFLLLALFGLMFSACTEDGGIEDDNGTQVETPSDNDDNDNGGDNKDDDGGNNDDGGGDSEKPEDIFFALDKEEITIKPDGGSADIVVYSNYKWVISGTSDWCTPSVKEGNANEDGQKVTFSADVAYDDREALFWFRCADKAIKLVVKQSLKKVIIADDNNTFDVPAEGGTIEIAYQTNVECEVVIPDEAKEWISLAPETKGLVSEKATLTVAENKTYEARSAVIKVVAVDNEALMAEYTINQACVYHLKYTSSNGEIVTPYKSNAFGATILVNEYKDGVGYLVFDAPVSSIGEDAFSGCSSLTSITIPDSVTYIGGSAFFNCSSLTSITIPDSVTSIGEDAFCGCSSLTSITIPDSVTYIGGSAFSGCSSLTSITIPDSVTYIGGSAFFNCSSLTSVTIPNSVTSIGEDAFCGCSSLTSITIPDSVTKIGRYAFASCISLTNVTIPDSVTSIGDYAFQYCSSLKSVTIGNSVTVIGYEAFRDCSSLTSVTIGNSVTKIGGYAFCYCHSLTSVTIPDSVTEIGEKAFYLCSSLKEVYCKSTTPPTAFLDGWGDWNAFYNNASGPTIYVPRNSVDAYKSAQYWSNYASAIVGYDF